MIGQELSPGDVIVYPSARSSSVYVNFAVIDQIIATSQPVYVGFKDGDRIETWDRAFKLKVRRVEQDELEPDRLAPPSRWDAATNSRVPQRLEDVKLSRIERVERVLKVEGMHVDGR